MRMQEMKTLSQQAFDWFNDKPVVQWTRSHFSESSTCDMLLNNVCETFNACILDARDKPILKMLEWIRKYLMRRLQENRDRSATKWKNRLCPKIEQILQKHANKVSDCMSIKADDLHYQVSCFDVKTYRECNPVIQPMSHVALWSESCIIPPLPPNFGRGAGRPPKARRRESDEPKMKNKKKSKKKQVQKLRRHQTTITAEHVGKGHNTANYLERVPFPTQEASKRKKKAPEAAVNTDDPNVRDAKRKKKAAQETQVGKEMANSTETQGATILPPLPPEEDPMDELTVDPCITQQESQVAAAPVWKKGPSMYQQLQQSNQHLTLQPRV
ncbi:UNVERIFIED_CONTAM: hypothetical protein Sindi_0012200 [Sesamum indicum]